MIRFNDQMRLCEECAGKGTIERVNGHLRPCVECDGVGAFNVSHGPCQHPPGSYQKVTALAFRLRQGIPLWHPEDATNESVLTRRAPDAPITHEEAEENRIAALREVAFEHFARSQRNHAEEEEV